MRFRQGIFGGAFPGRAALALFAALQITLLWFLFMAKFLSETAFLLLMVIFSGLFALATVVPVGTRGLRREILPDPVIPGRAFVPAPEAEMASPLIRLRTSLRPRSEPGQAPGGP